MIDVLVPVLDRPDNVQPFLDSLRSNTSVETRVIFLCSPEDKAEIAACEASGETTRIVDWAPTTSDYPRKMNAGFKIGTNPWLLLGADDITFQAGWDTEALRVAEATGAYVIGTNDMAHPDVKRGLTSTHPLVSRRYVTDFGASIDGPGSLIHEGYDHNYCERELVCLARSREMWAFSRKSVIRHRHPAWGTAPEDATYRKGTQTIGRDHQLFLTRSHYWGGVGLTPRETANSRRFRRRAERTR